MVDTLKNATFISNDTTTAALLVPNNSNIKTVLSIIACNVDTDDCEFDVYLNGDPAGADTSDNYRIYNNQPIPAGATFIHDSKIVVTTGTLLYFIQRQSTAAAIVHVTVSYLDQTT